MEQMKNKDGIALKVGQVWTGIGTHEHRRILCFDGNLVIYRDVDGLIFDCLLTNDYFTTLIKSHNGADLEQARKDGWAVWLEGAAEPSRVSMVDLGDVGEGYYLYKLKEEEPEQKTDNTALLFQLSNAHDTAVSLEKQVAQLKHENAKLTERLDKIQSDLVLFTKGNHLG